MIFGEVGQIRPDSSLRSSLVIHRGTLGGSPKEGSTYLCVATLGGGTLAGSNVRQHARSAAEATTLRFVARRRRRHAELYGFRPVQAGGRMSHPAILSGDGRPYRGLVSFR